MNDVTLLGKKVGQGVAFTNQIFAHHSNESEKVRFSLKLSSAHLHLHSENRPVLNITRISGMIFKKHVASSLNGRYWRCEVYVYSLQAV